MQSIKKELEQLFFEERWQELKNLTNTYLRKDKKTDAIALLYSGVAEIETENPYTGLRKIQQYLDLDTFQSEEEAIAYFYLGRAFDLNKKPLLADEFYNKAITKAPHKKSYKIFKLVNLFNNQLFQEIKDITHEKFGQWEDLELFPLVIMTAYEQTNDEGQIPHKIIELCSKFAGEIGDKKTIKKYIDFLVKCQKKEQIIEYIKTLEKSEENQEEIDYANGKMQENLKNFEQAEIIYKNSIERKFNHLNAEALIDLILKRNRIKDAIAKIQEWLSNGNDDLTLRFRLASIYVEMPSYVYTAVEMFNAELKEVRNVKLQKDIEWNLSLSLLSIGNLKEGWQKYRSREGKLLKRTFSAELWEGNKLLPDQKIMIWSEQGVGDHLMFATALPDLLETVGKNKIIFETDPRLLSLLQRSFPDIEIRKNPRLKRDLSPYVTDYHYHLPIATLQTFFRKKIEDYPGKKFLITNKELDSLFKERLSINKLKVGIIWRSQTQSHSRDRAYLTIQDLKFLVRDTDQIEWVNLQYGDCTEELEWLKENTGVELKQWEDINLKDDFDAVASLISNLDLVISPSSSILQLAGGLGVRTWTFNPYPLWTMFNQKYYPWFNSVRVYQVDFPNSMKYTIPAMVQDLSQWLSTGMPPPSKSQVLINLKDAQEQLELMAKKAKIDKCFLSEEQAEKELAMGCIVEEIQSKIASTRLAKKIKDFPKKSDQYLCMLEQKPKIHGLIEDIKNLLIEQTEQDLSFEIQTKFKTQSKTLILSFQENISQALPFSLVTPYFYPKFAWTSIASKFDNISLLQVRDSWQMWYQAGPLGSCLLHPEKAADKWLELMTPKIEQSKAEKIICVGTSAGASAAIQFGAKLNADAVVAISPQARPLDGEWEIESGGFSFLEEGGDWRKQVRDKFNLSSLDLKPYADDLGDRLHIIIPKLNKTDITHADYLTQNNPNIQLYRSTGKNHGDVNKKLIFDIIKKLI